MSEAEQNSGAVEQLRKLAVAAGFAEVWSDPNDETTWFMQRPHPSKEGMIQVLPFDLAGFAVQHAKTENVPTVEDRDNLRRE